jgi:hypothetical protein
VLSVQALSHARTGHDSPFCLRHPASPAFNGFNIHYLSAYYSTISVNNPSCNLIENLERQATTPVYQTVDSRKHIAQDEKHH